MPSRTPPKPRLSTNLSGSEDSSFSESEQKKVQGTKITSLIKQKYKGLKTSRSTDALNDFPTASPPKPAFVRTLPGRLTKALKSGRSNSFTPSHTRVLSEPEPYSPYEGFAVPDEPPRSPLRRGYSDDSALLPPPKAQFLARPMSHSFENLPGTRSSREFRNYDFTKVQANFATWEPSHSPLIEFGGGFGSAAESIPMDNNRPRQNLIESSPRPTSPMTRSMSPPQDHDRGYFDHAAVSAPPESMASGKPEDDLSRNLHDAWTIASQPIKKGTAVVLLEKIGSGITSGDNLTAAQTVITNVMASAAGDVIEKIEDGIKSFIDSSGPLLAALDEVAKLHPFIGVALLAFKAVWALEMKRRENDKRILALYVEIKDMMAVLVQLKNCKDVEDVAPDGSTIKARMQELCQQTADDIKACANLCDCYTKKKLVVKVLKGPIWEGKLLKFVALFTKRRSEFEFSLAIHTAVGVDTIVSVTAVMDEKMNQMMLMMQKLMPQANQDMARTVAMKGGANACLDDPSILRELNSQSDGSATIAHPGGQTKSLSIEELQQDLHADPDEAIEKNSAVFNRKFEVQKRQIVEELEKVIKREGDRIINALGAGPHDRILDPDIHTIWKDMGWRGSIKVRHFVMSVRDYYTESENKVAKDDMWALAYINVLRIQPIGEAFDDDTSGYLTVAEANAFTAARPIDWSLPRWIAYWAIGWHQSLVVYRSKINDLMAKMFALLPKVKPLNQPLVNDYLAAVYVGVTSLQDGVSDCIINDALQEKFAGHVNAEEARLKGNLEAVEYDIDAADTLILVTGEGRIEKFVMPLLYLLLKRHLDIFRLAQKRNLHADELWDAADTIQWVLKAVNARVEVLQSVFGQQKLNLKQHFKTFAHGLLQHVNDPSERWNPKVVQSSEPAEYTYDDALEAEEDLDPKKILNYPFDEELKDFAAYHASTDSSSTFSSHITPALKKVIGPSGWNGFHYRSNSSLVPVNGMIHINFLPEDGSKEGKFKGSSRSNGLDFKISGQVIPSENSDVVNFTLRMAFPPPHPAQNLKGSWSAITDTLTGTWDTEATVVQKGVFMYKRMLPDNFCYYPPPGALKSNKPRALWKFALDAIQADIRKKNLPWCFFEDRRRQRHSFIALFLRTRFGRPLTDEETEVLRRIQHGLTNADNLFYLSVAKLQVRKTVVHAEPCESCGGIIGGARLSCLTCQLVDKFDTIDFCEHPGCLSQRIVRPHLAQPHLPSHDLLKVRRVVHIRQFGKTYRDAKDALQRARSLLASASQTNQPEGNTSDSDEDMNEVTPACGACKLPVSQPCWFCVHCEKTTFICFACEPNLNKGKILNSDPKTLPNHDIHTHDLVRVQELVDDVKISMDDRLEAMDVRLSKFEGRVEDRLARVERLLEQLLIDSKKLPSTS
ncbi:hypothetical protein C8J56DRAFT_139201 [Mycena floridula]|nr:hypothetical protein C8J56DRAFT_139201 [Mycena floridula]